MNMKFEEAIGEILISKEMINDKVKEMAERITNTYSDESEDLIVVGLLKGSIVFMSDLIREIKLPVKIDFMTVSSYGNSTTSSREVKILKDMSENIMGKNVLIVEDIIDSGLTLNKVMEILRNREPKSLKLCTFLSKPARREVDVKVDFMGYEIPDKFVVGYGLDWAEKYRNLPYIGVVKGE